MTRYRTSKKSLRIRDVDKTDSGRFTCKGINGFGKEEIKIDLIIIDPLDFPGLPEGALPEVFLAPLLGSLQLISNHVSTQFLFLRIPFQIFPENPPSSGDSTCTDKRHPHSPDEVFEETGGNFEDFLRSPWQAKAGDHLVQERARAVGECEGEARQVRPPCARPDGQRLRQVGDFVEH